MAAKPLVQVLAQQGVKAAQNLQDVRIAVRHAITPVRKRHHLHLHVQGVVMCAARHALRLATILAEPAAANLA